MSTLGSFHRLRGAGEDFPAVRSALDDVVAQHSCLGATLRVLHRGVEVLNVAVGDADADRGLSQDMVVPWFSASKLAATVAVARAWDTGLIRACMAGPFGDAAEICEMLRTSGLSGTEQILRPVTCATLITDHRPPTMVDESAGTTRRWGLGVVLAAPNFGPASPRSFGALGGTACLVFSDPATELTVALYFVGNTGVADRLARDRYVLNALYRDLI